jgi:glycosyltransferase involved in cell wall biosynthesis
MISIIASNKRVVFANPFRHHSFFTVWAVSRATKDVHVLCPPLSLDILLKTWRFRSDFYSTTSVLLLLCSFFLQLAFILHKLRVVTHARYVKIFNIITQQALSRLGSCVLICYQDYIDLRQVPASVIVINELINTSLPDSSNFSSTLRNASNANLLVAPTGQLLNLFRRYQSNKHTSIIAPYGGNKSAYLYNVNRNKVSETRIKTAKLINSFKVVARCHSYAKGGSMLLDSICLLAEKIDPLQKFHIQICGNLYGTDMLNHFKQAQNYLKAYPNINISSKLYQPPEYLCKLKYADLFIMLSKSESQSLAALEALYEGIPCILTAECGINLFQNRRHGFIVPSNSPDVLSFLLCRLLKDTEELKELRNNLKCDKNIFTWDSYIDAYQDAIARLAYE